MSILFAAVGIAALLFVLAGTAHGVRCSLEERRKKLND
jgi:hypothetical protein